MSTNLPQDLAPNGAIWVCSCCGKYGKDRYTIGDESCFMHAVLCREDSLLLGDNGFVRDAKPWEGRENEP